MHPCREKHREYMRQRRRCLAVTAAPPVVGVPVAGGRPLDATERNDAIMAAMPGVNVAVRRAGLRGEAAEEAAGVATVELCRAAERYREGQGATVKTFLTTRIWGAVVDSMRAAVRLGGLPVRLSVPSTATRTGVRLDVRGALGALTDKQREVIGRLYGVDGYDAEAPPMVARRMWITPDAVQRLRRRAFARLRVALSSYRNGG